LNTAWAAILAATYTSLCKTNKMIRSIYLITIAFLTFSINASAQATDSLRQAIQQIVATKKALVGVSIIGNNGRDTVSLNGDRRYPLQSVFKFHIALAMLDQIDKGKFSLHQKVTIQQKDLLPDLWSPLREENPKGGRFPISKLIQYSVAQSDNVGCDALLRLLGGPAAVEAYFQNNNINNVGIKLNEETLQSNWDRMFENWTTPQAASQTLQKFYAKQSKLLSPKSYAFIWTTMQSTQTGAARLKGLLPKGTVVAHKTGSSGTNKAGVTEAVNDIGIVFLPNGSHFIISVFVTHSTENEATNERIIAEIAKAAWDYYTAKRR
jgi:beta-lactamase class A